MTAKLILIRTGKDTIRTGNFLQNPIYLPHEESSNILTFLTNLVTWEVITFSFTEYSLKILIQLALSPS